MQQRIFWGTTTRDNFPKPQGNPCHFCGEPVRIPDEGLFPIYQDLENEGIFPMFIEPGEEQVDPNLINLVCIRCVESNPEVKPYLSEKDLWSFYQEIRR